MKLRAVLAIPLSLLMVFAPAVPAASPAVVGKINTKGMAEVNGVAVPAEATVFNGDRIATQKETASGLSLPGGDQVFLPSLSAAQVQRIENQVTVALERGALAVVNRSAQPVVVEAGGVRIQAKSPAGSIYEVAVQGTSLKVMARRGLAMVKASNRTVEVKEGTTLEATVAPPPAGAGGMGPLMTVVLVGSAALGVAGFVLGVQALRRSEPQDCVVVSPNLIRCPE